MARKRPQKYVVLEKSNISTVLSAKSIFVYVLIEGIRLLSEFKPSWMGKYNTFHLEESPRQSTHDAGAIL